MIVLLHCFRFYLGREDVFLFPASGFFYSWKPLYISVPNAITFMNLTGTLREVMTISKVYSLDIPASACCLRRVITLGYYSPRLIFQDAKGKPYTANHSLVGHTLHLELNLRDCKLTH